MSKFFSKRRFHLSSPAKLIPTFSSTFNSNYDNNSSKSSPGDYSINGWLLLSPQSKKKLTRQRKLRHLTLEDYCAPEEDVRGVSKSLPSSPISGSKSPHQLPQHWSSSAVPQPLPLPVDDLRLPGEGYSGGNGRSDRHGMNAKCGGVPISSKPSTYARRKGYPQDINGDKVHNDIRLRVPARSAPTTTFTSPTLSPKFSTVDIFDSALAGTREFSMLPPSDASTRRSQLHSPPLQSPYLINRTESNNNNVHPLPLPPSRPVSRHQSLDKSGGKSTKGQWQKGKLLGHGTFGTVYEATNRETGSLCAMKVVDIIPDDPKSSECLRQLEQEIKVLQNLEHPNIVHYLGSEMVEDRFCIYIEYVHPGPLNKYVREHYGAITESVVRNFTRHILSGLAYLHSKKTVHRDIKGANLLVDASGVVKLADFGLAKHLSAHTIDLSLQGSPHWMAPELLQAVMRKDVNPEHAFTMDIWSLGCTVIEMVTGKPPWSEFTGAQAMFNVLNRSPPIPETLSSKGKDFLNLCLQRNPEKRASAALLLEHPFVRRSFDHNISLCEQKFSSLRFNEILHIPRDLPALPKDMMQRSPSTSVKHDRPQFHCGTPKHPNLETKTDQFPASTRHSPRSTLEVVTSEFTHNNGVPNRTGKGRTYSLPVTPSGETYQL
ncbi:mitogen-activated protein kinase kinase kinase 5-like isoform X2 [Bidens hawaiensis]|uniref:mitogen-activated protein kinase kinase kinase 5-like isoform X2 n=1 Tax=Bidens hawaiensis TaxID=980011 RepID=UPI0040494819